METHKKIWYAPNKKEAYGEEEIKAVIECLNEGWLGGNGEKTIEFENKVSILFNKKYGIFVNSGSSAILLGLKSLELNEGDEVITPACTFATTLAPIVQCGLTPVFCDVVYGRYVPSVEEVISKITEKTKVILLPNLIGSKPDWNELKKQIDIKSVSEKISKIILFEDSADTITSTPESDISITSFYSSHLITACGSGGMLMVNDLSILKNAKMYRDWGRIGDNEENYDSRFVHSIDGIPYDYKFLYKVVGYNFKSSEVNAAFGLAQLTKLNEIKSLRKKIFNRYLENLKFVEEIVKPMPNDDEDWLAIAFMVDDRYGLLKFLEENNIQTRLCFSGNITRHPAYRNYLQPFKISDMIMEKGFLLGAHHGMSIEDVDYICDKIKEYFTPLHI